MFVGVEVNVVGVEVNVKFGVSVKAIRRFRGKRVGVSVKNLWHGNGSLRDYA